MRRLLFVGCLLAACDPAPQITNNGGTVLRHPTVYPIFFANDDSPTPTAIEAFLQQLAGSKYWSDVTAEYGVGSLALGAKSMLPAPGSMIDDSDIPHLLSTYIAAGMVPAPSGDNTAIYALFYAEDTLVTLNSEILCVSGPLSYHSSGRLTDGTLVAYTPVPRCGAPGTADDVVTGFQVTSLTHELVEASTDPNAEGLSQQNGDTPAWGGFDVPHFYWGLILGSELADVCNGGAPDPNGYFVSEFGYSLPRVWSNKSAAGGHDPCVPAPSEAYFNAAPYLPDQITEHVISNGGTLDDVRIPFGQSRTIPITLFSDGDTHGDWTVQAQDLASLSGGSPTMDLKLDSNHGQNGDILNLTITPKVHLTTNEDFFVVTSTNAAKVIHFWIGMVGEK